MFWLKRIRDLESRVKELENNIVFCEECGVALQKFRAVCVSQIRRRHFRSHCRGDYIHHAYFCPNHEPKEEKDGKETGISSEN
jgi:hypothetical protein